MSCDSDAALWSVHPIVGAVVGRHAGVNMMKKRVCGLVLGGLVMMVFDGCASPQERRLKQAREHAFISYWPATTQGQGQGLRLAVKDNIDMKGRVTSAGSEFVAKNSPPAVRDAPCLALGGNGMCGSWAKRT